MLEDPKQQVPQGKIIYIGNMACAQFGADADDWEYHRLGKAGSPEVAKHFAELLQEWKRRNYAYIQPRACSIRSAITDFCHKWVPHRCTRAACSFIQQELGDVWTDQLKAEHVEALRKSAWKHFGASPNAFKQTMLGWKWLILRCDDGDLLRRHQLHIYLDEFLMYGQPGEHLPPQQLYRYYDAHGQLLYVGVSKSAIHRMFEHKSAQTWWLEVTDTKIETKYGWTREEIEDLERDVIREENPRYNVSRPKPRTKPDEPEQVLANREGS